MLKKLKIKLIITYTAILGIIITLIMGFMLYLTINQHNDNEVNNFLSNAEYAAESLSDKNDYWDESIVMNDNSVVILAEDGNDIHFYNGIKQYNDNEVTPATKRKLIEHVKDLAAEDNICVEGRDIAKYNCKSPMYTFKWRDGCKYYAIAYVYVLDGISYFDMSVDDTTVLLVPIAARYRSIIYVKKVDESNNFALNITTLYIAIDILVIIILCFITSRLVIKALIPVEQAQIKQKEFIAAASHELKSPLTVISINNSAIMANQNRTEEFSKIIGYECKRMGRLVDDLLILASNDTNNWSIKKDDVDVETLLIEIYDSYESVCRNNNINLSIELPEESINHIDGDMERLKQLLSIIIDNAFGSDINCSKLILKAVNKKHWVYIYVIDNGVGIPDDIKEKVFERFFRGDKARRKKEHFGLGLSVARELVLLHNGSITIEDTPDGGATFVIKIPTKHIKNKEN